MTGLPTPTSSVTFENGQEVQVYRCDTDGALVLPFGEHLKLHAGHRLKQPVILKKEDIEFLEGLNDLS